MPRELWNSVLHSLESSVNKQSFNMWLKDTEPLSISENTLKIKVIDEVTKRHISEQYLNQISLKLKEITGLHYICEFVTSNGSGTEQSQNSNGSQAMPTTSYFKREPMSTESTLNPKYTFENFVIGPNNQYAHAAAYSVSQAPGTQVNPLFIYGSTGLGKTHLLQAIGNYINHEKPYLKVLFVSTGDFITEFINAIRNRTQESFQIKYRHVDILLIDDIQFLENKEETQNEFFQVFNSLHGNKKQIVISSDRPPKQIATLADRLRTRFEWGMITDIQAPNLETREAILRDKAEKEKLVISDEAFNYIARRIKSNIRALEAAVSKLKMISQFTREEISIDMVKLHLKELFDVDSNKMVSIGDIINKVSEKFDVSQEDLKSKSRHSRIIQPRFIGMYLARDLAGMTTTDIGKEFGDRDHSTVINACNKIMEDMNNDPEFKELINDLIIELKS
ncbi:MAG TPA: chromosomal replication initiator protein DnaA [Spirochaetota bacterium]|nr:chromosomal replication initiator protein DnaA [Spirochaetota bacterium]HPC39465.1 chromosomal replication initiator protein DnaA [Spirochaetota bacterium]HPL15871.1 chromosomal replication initiator protein DnaA [Spirochaetota bacterium]HQF06802.1 chromosomal replication initiator protein DnaA [Spirochaetota bacterium]HQH95579.1 chromosomal replication initiator protein DnaA [Spirochaetota bacterium]